MAPHSAGDTELLCVTGAGSWPRHRRRQPARSCTITFQSVRGECQSQKQQNPEHLKQTITRNTINYCCQILHHSSMLRVVCLREENTKSKTCFCFLLIPSLAHCRRNSRTPLFNYVIPSVSFTYVSASWSYSGWGKKNLFQKKSEITSLTCHTEGYGKIENCI